MKRFIFYCKQCGFEYSGPNANPIACSYCGTVNDLAYVEGDIIAHKIMKIKKKCLCCGREFSVDPWIIKDFCDRCYPVVVQEVFDRNNDNLTVEQLKNKIKEKLKMKKMTEKDFVELVYNYGASGDKVFEDLNLKPAQIEDVACAWAEFDEDDSEAETDKKFADYFPGFELDGKWYVNYNEKDLSGYYTGVGGMVDEDNKGIANSQDYAMKFDSKEEAESWVAAHAEEWIHGDLSVW